MKTKTEEKKQLIMDTARDLILETGLQSASVSKISKASGVPVGSIYHAFENKEDLINQVYLRSRDRIVGVLEQEHRGSVEEILKSYLEDYIDNALSHPKDFIFVENHHLSPVIDRKNMIPPDIVVGGEKISALMAHEQLRKGAPDILVTAVLGMLHNCIANSLSGMISLGKGEKRQLIDMCWSAVSGH